MFTKTTPDETKLEEEIKPSVVSATESEEPVESNSNCVKCEEYLNLAKRARADYENLKKENEKWEQDFIKYAHEGLVLELLPVLDNFHEAMSHIPEAEKVKDWVIGITYIKKQLEDFLKAQGVEIYAVSGDKFDPNYHEAISEVNDLTIGSGNIVKVIRRGYKQGAKVVRAAQVVVGK